MSEENDKKLYNHFKAVIAGAFNTSNSVSNELRVSDAKRHMADLVSKRPDIVFEEPKTQTKSKGKK